jgi:hypothetical protein
LTSSIHARKITPPVVAETSEREQGPADLKPGWIVSRGSRDPVGVSPAGFSMPLALAVAEMARLTGAWPANPAADSVDIFHGGSWRVGVLRVRGQAVAYVQAGDLATVVQRPVWEVPATLDLSLTDLPARAAALKQATVETARDR